MMHGAREKVPIQGAGTEYDMVERGAGITEATEGEQDQYLGRTDVKPEHQENEGSGEGEHRCQVVERGEGDCRGGEQQGE
jgi:hypothetical protein